MTRRAPASSRAHAGSAPRSASSAEVSGPSTRSASATPSASLIRRSSVRHWSSCSSSARTSASSSSRSSAWPSSSDSSRESSESAAARRSASGESPSYRNCATYPKSRERAKGDASGVVTSTRRTRRASRSPISSVSPGTSKTSWRHSRTASRTIGNEPNSLATWSSCEARCRCCHSGVRLPGLRRGSSSARAAHSRNREANSAELPTWSVTIPSISPLSKVTSWAPTGDCSVSKAVPGSDASSSSRSSPRRSASGRRSTIPSSACITWASMPYRSLRRAPSASAHGACTCAPNGEWITTRQSPSSSRNRSTTTVRSSGTCPHASRCSFRYVRRFSAAQASSPAASSRSRASSSGSAPTSRTKAPSARPSSSGRPSWSPFQNGRRPGTPGAGETRTRSRVMSSIRHEVVPSVKTSPVRDS